MPVKIEGLNLTSLEGFSCWTKLPKAFFLKPQNVECLQVCGGNGFHEDLGARRLKGVLNKDVDEDAEVLNSGVVWCSSRGDPITYVGGVVSVK